MPKRKPLIEDSNAKSKAQNRQKRGLETPEESAQTRTIEAQRMANACKIITPEEAAKRRTVSAERIANLRKRETPIEIPTKKVGNAQQMANGCISESQIKYSDGFIKGKKMMLILNRVERNVTQTLLQHGLTLSHSDLQTLCNLRKLPKASVKPSAMKTDSNKTKDPSIPTVSLRTSGIPQLTVPLTQPKQQQRVLNITLNPQPAVAVQSASVPAATCPSQVIISSDKNWCKDQFLEHLELTKQVKTPTTYSRPIVKRSKKIAQVVKNSNVQEKSVEPLKKKPLLFVSKEINIPSATAPLPVVFKTFPNSQANSRNVRVVSRVQIMKLPVDSLQKLQNNKSHIQYLSSKKDLSPQETLLLPKLLENQQRILSTGKSVPTTPGQSVQGIPFLSGDCMYVVQSNTTPALPDTRRSLNAEPAPSAAFENRSDSSLNLLQAKIPDKKSLHQLTPKNERDYILPDSERTNCNHHSCVIEVALLRTQLDQKSIALESCNLELENLRTELEKAKEYIGNLRAQLEENTQTLCSYLAANSS